MTARPIQLAPDLDPADTAHVQRWLDELVGVVERAGAWLGHHRGPQSLPVDPNHARWLDG